jgi:flagellin-like hook-associated protein FlgL
MTSDVVLTAALRANLLSLQNTQSMVDITQNRLATGRKINSALDGPQSFFASQALNNRAADLTRLLDSIGQSIQVIKAADTGVTALTRLVEQADSVATAARDALNGASAEAKATGNRDLRGINDIAGLPGITAGDTFTLQLTDDSGATVNIGAYGAASGGTAAIALNANDSTEEIIAKINNLHVDDGTGMANGAQAFEAKLNDSGFLEIRTIDGGSFRAVFNSGGGSDAENFALAAELGFGDVARLVPDGAAAPSNNVEFTATSKVALTSFVLYDDTTVPPRIAPASTLLSDVTDSTGATNRFAGLNSNADDYLIGINGGAQQAINMTDAAGAPLTIQSFVDQINNNTSLNTKVKAAYDDQTGEITITPIDGSVKSIEIGVRDTATANLGFGVNPNLSVATATDREVESIRLASATAELAQLEDDYNSLRDQITQLVTNGDTGYRGTNLLNGDDLTTFFNESRTSSLVLSGSTFTADGLGMDEADFSRASSIDLVLSQVRDALSSVRSFGSTLANGLSVIQTRENFTKSLIDTLKEGSDKLTVADQNEEGAKLLALQTRQSLGVTSLSLASQSQQSILRLFG